MTRSDRKPLPAGATSPRALALAAVLGLAGTLVVLRYTQPEAPATPAPRVDGGAVARPQAPATPIAPPRAAPASAAPAATIALDLDDETLLQRARDEFGLECTDVDRRRATASGAIEVDCTNGTRLRVERTSSGALNVAVAE